MGDGTRSSLALVEYGASALAPLAGNAAIGLALPSSQLIQSALANDPNAACAMSELASSYLMYGAFQGVSPLDASVASTTDAALTLQLDVTQLVGATALRIAFLDPASQGNGFESLRLLIRLDGADQVDQTFTDVGSAMAFFDDGVLELADPSALGSLATLEVYFWLNASGAGDGFFVDYVVAAVPEPDIALILALTGVTAALRRRSRIH